MKALNTTDLKKAIKSWGRTPFDGVFDLNIVVITSERNDDNLNTFCDWAYALYKNEAEKWESIAVPCTGIPGEYYLRNPMNRAGTAIVAEGFHSGLWSLGLHKGTPALRQVGNVTVHRDSDMDKDPETHFPKFRGIYGINFHGASKRGRSTQVDRWSAGCVVTPLWSDVDRFRSLVKRQDDQGLGNKVSLLLIREETLREKGFTA